MPLYDYKCTSCGHVTEIRHGFDENFEGACPVCSSRMARVFSAAPIVFKGSGFYVTDSRKGKAATKPSSETKNAESSGDQSKSDHAKSGDAKPEPKSSESASKDSKSGESAA
jgi:putative FmdB family regulatory protein